MAITYPLSLPASPAFRIVRFAPRAVAAASVSPFTGTVQVQAHQGGLWIAELTLPPMTRAEAETWLAFLLSLNGMEGTFLLGDPLGAAPRGAGGGTPQVNGASQTGQELNTKGWPAATLVLKAGDWIQLGTGTTQRIHKVLKDATSDGAGLATLDIWPRLRESPADSAGIVISDAKGTFRLAGNDMGWDEELAAFYGLAFGAVEALPAV